MKRRTIKKQRARITREVRKWRNLDRGMHWNWTYCGFVEVGGMAEAMHFLNREGERLERERGRR